MAMIGIYKITSPSGKVYIGQSWNIKHRWFVYRGSMCKGQPKLNQSFMSHGARNHKYEIISELPKDVTQRVLDNHEIFYINAYKGIGVPMLNLKSGGLGGRHSEETKLKLSVSQKGTRKVNSGSFKKGHKLIRTQEHCENISKSLTGKTISEETKKKLSIINTGKVSSAETRRKISEANKGKFRGGKKIVVLKGRAKGERHGMSVLTWSQVDEIRSKYIPRVYSSLRLAKEYKISKIVILKIIHNKLWKK